MLYLATLILFTAFMLCLSIPFVLARRRPGSGCSAAACGSICATPRACRGNQRRHDHGGCRSENRSERLGGSGSHDTPRRAAPLPGARR